MADNPIVRLANLRLIRDSAALEAELDSRAPGWFIEIYRRLRTSAAESVAAIMFCAPDEKDNIQALQNHARLFDLFVTHVKAILADGIALDQSMTDQERTEVLEVLVRTPEGTREAADLGLIDQID